MFNFNKREYENILIYPNPFINTVFIILPFRIGNTIIRISNLQGMIIFEKANLEEVQKLDLSDLKPGIYVLEIISERSDNIILHKIVKI